MDGCGRGTGDSLLPSEAEGRPSRAGAQGCRRGNAGIRVAFGCTVPAVGYEPTEAKHPKA